MRRSACARVPVFARVTPSLRAAIEAAAAANCRSLSAEIDLALRARFGDEQRASS